MMKKTIIKTIIIILIPLILFIIALLFYYPSFKVIAFSYEDSEQLLAYLPLKEEKTFQLKYTHSIHLSDVIETYEATSKNIKLTTLEYEDFAVGMPSNAEGDEIFKVTNGKYQITNMKRIFPYIDLRIGQVRANHQLIYLNKTYTLSDYIKPGTWVRISLKRISLWQQLKGVNL